MLVKLLNTFSVIRAERQRAREAEYFPKLSSSPIISLDMTLSAAVVTEHEVSCQSWLFLPSLPPRRAGRAEANARKEHKLFIIPCKLYITTTSKLPSFVYFHIYE